MMPNQVETFSETLRSQRFPGTTVVAYINTLINMNTAVHREINRSFGTLRAPKESFKARLCGSVACDRLTTIDKW